ncbi:unnamed protein product [Clonostachys chloroleuca]|uniref:Kinase-like protein n=1 Tax=Clonostachys chloroleuca TaxID=1926264 RepID=A0AA35MCU8_9HYPO|nr:unnamed protein product [Clonostachys chloroleuca]
MGVLARLRPVHDFKAQEKGDLDLLAGQMVLVTELLNDDWWKGRLADSNGPEGMFPRSYGVVISPSSGQQFLKSPKGGFEAYSQVDYNGDLHLGLSFKVGDRMLVYVRLTSLLSWGVNLESNFQGVFHHTYVQTYGNPDSAGIMQANAIASYDGTVRANLALAKGDVLLVKHILDYEVAWARNSRTCLEGLCPAALIVPAVPADKDDSKPRTVPLFSPNKVTALYTWPGETIEDLQILKYDQILVIQTLDDENWLKGVNLRTGKTGIFPRTYVRFQEVTSSQVEPKSSDNVDTLAISQPRPAVAISPRQHTQIQPSLLAAKPVSQSGPARQPDPAPATPTPTESTRIPVLEPPTRPVLGSRLDTDLVRDSKLDTSFTGEDVVCHTSYTFHPRNRHNRIVVEEKWKLERYLGRGGFGQVDLQKCVQGPKEGELRAVKMIVKNPFNDETKKINYDRELEAIAKFSHEKASDIQFIFWHSKANLLCSLQYVHCFARSFGWYENENAIFITMEFFEHGDLQKLMRGRFPEFEVGQITSQILEGLSYMHDNGFAHRDLKPANILVKERSPNWWIKISDFGISKRASGDHTALHTLVGTPRYLAPEVMRIFSPEDTEDMDSDTMAYTMAIDQWALGAIAFQLLASRDPFPQPRSLQNYVHGKEPFPSSVLTALQISEPCIEFLKSLLTPIPSRRPNASSALKHPWLEEISQSPQLVDQSITFIEDEFSLIRFEGETASISWTEALQKP